MRQRLRFGDAVSLARVAARGAVGGSFKFEVPTFGPHCVCCSADAQGRVQSYDPSTDRRTADPVPMPVCLACKDHALKQPFAAIMQAMGILVGGAITALGAMYAADRPGDSVLKWMMVVGVAMIVLSIAWIRSSSRARARAAGNGHHPGLELSLATGATVLDTDNETLVEDLLAKNPRAVRVPTPLLWRLRGDGMPKAKVVKRTD
jgi:hypothetical protein